jgi:hypothetical protein
VPPAAPPALQSQEQQLLEQWKYMVEGPGNISFDAEREAQDAVAQLLAAEVRATGRG